MPIQKKTRVPILMKTQVSIVGHQSLRPNDSSHRNNYNIQLGYALSYCN